jgi:hypothetical protein
MIWKIKTRSSLYQSRTDPFVTPFTYPKLHISAHLKGNVPAGGNIGMLDSHAEWRKFDLMVPRGSGGVGGAQDNGTCPTFWW